MNNEPRLLLFFPDVLDRATQDSVGLVAIRGRGPELSPRAARPHPARTHGAPVRLRRPVDADNAADRGWAAAVALAGDAARLLRALCSGIGAALEHPRGQGAGLV